MKQLFYLTMAITLFLGGTLCAQNFEGIATYKTQRKLDIKMDSTQVNDQMKERIMAMMKKQFEREYTLDFNKDESVYKVVESLDAPNPVGGGGMQVVVAGAGQDAVLYKNIGENRIANKNDIFGKTFLIKDSLPNLDWTLTKETKNIGQYTCFKATRTETRTMRSVMSSSDESGESSASDEQQEEITITAWYTPQIPLAHGPAQYHGLPGLILEASDGSETILCSKIVMNPKDGVTVKEPEKGKVVTQQEFDAIMDQKLKEMQDRYQPGNRRDGHSMQIRIGG